MASVRSEASGSGVVGETEEFSDQEPDLDSDSGLPGNILLIHYSLNYIDYILDYGNSCLVRLIT